MIEYYTRRLQEKDIPIGYSDPYGIFESANFERTILLKSPFLQSDDDVFQVLAVKNHEFVGTEIHFPIELSLNGVKYLTISGHGLSVEKECRGAGVGSKLTDGRLDYSPTHSLLLGGASQMHLSILRKFNAIVFEMPRLIYLRNSRSVLEGKLGRIISKVVTPIANVALKFYFVRINKEIKKLQRRFQVEELNTVIDEVISIVECDKHICSEVHNKEWFNWILNNTLIPNEKPIKKLYIVKNSGKVVGFFLNETRFYEKASHRGFKNVTLNSIIEWGSIDQNIISDNEICSLAISVCNDKSDAVEVCCINETMKTYFKKRQLVQVGEGNVCLRYRPDSVFAQIEGLSDVKNWRLRPAMGDHSLS